MIKSEYLDYNKITDVILAVQDFMDGATLLKANGSEFLSIKGNRLVYYTIDGQSIKQNSWNNGTPWTATVMTRITSSVNPHDFKFICDFRKPKFNPVYRAAIADHIKKSKKIVWESPGCFEENIVPFYTEQVYNSIKKIIDVKAVCPDLITTLVDNVTLVEKAGEFFGFDISQCFDDFIDKSGDKLATAIKSEFGGDLPEEIKHIFGKALFKYGPTIQAKKANVRAEEAAIDQQIRAHYKLASANTLSMFTGKSSLWKEIPKSPKITYNKMDIINDTA